MVGKMLDAATQEYLDRFKKEIINMLSKMEENIDKVMTLTLKNIESDLKTVKEDSAEQQKEIKTLKDSWSIFDKEYSVESTVLKGRIKELEKDLSNGKKNKKFVIGVVISIISVLIAAVAVIIKTV